MNPLKSLSSLGISKLEWVQPRSREERFELRFEGAVYATLTFRSAFGTLAVAETGEGRWSFKRIGFLQPRVTVRILDQPLNLAVYQPKLLGEGLLTFHDGRSLAWRPGNFWATEWGFIDDRGAMIMKFHTGVEQEKLSDIFKMQATVELGSTDAFREGWSFLSALGFYLLILHRKDVAVTTAAIT